MASAALGDLVRSMDDPGAAAERAGEVAGLVLGAAWMGALLHRGNRPQAKKQAARAGPARE